MFEYAGHRVELPEMPLESQQWYSVHAGFADGGLVLGAREISGGSRSSSASIAPSPALPPAPATTTLVFAAELTGAVSSHNFNGRLEDPKLFASAEEMRRGRPLAHWDFARAIDTQTIVDVGPRGLAGRLRNVPTRAMRGSRWTGAQMDWQKAPGEYAAIHFHEDDLYDCAWEASTKFRVPAGTASGCFGLRLRVGGSQDILPFYVLAPRGEPGSRVAFLAPTLTYLAYANHARGNCDEAMRARMREWKCTPYNADDFPVFGRSTYNYHAGTAPAPRDGARPHTRDAALTADLPDPP